MSDQASIYIVMEIVHNNIPLSNMFVFFAETDGITCSS